MLPRRCRFGIALLAMAVLSAAAHAQAPEPATGNAGAPAEVSAPAADPRLAVREAHMKELKDLEAAAVAAAAKRDRTEMDAANLKADREHLNEALVATGERIHDKEARAAAAEDRLLTLRTTEDAIRQSLKGREAILVEVLAALQRLGRRPPPAVLARPEDMLQAVRTAILLGAVVPDLKAEAEALAGDLSDLARLRDGANAEREKIAGDLKDLADDQMSVTALITERQKRIAEVEADAGRERSEALRLAGQAKDVQGLIDGLDRDIASAAKAAEDAQRKLEAQSRETRERFAAAAFKDPARLAPKVAFAEAKGLLPLPIAGQTLTAFGAPDGFGGTTHGVSLAARPGALVSSPTDGWVTYAGPFRSFGKMLILNCGNGYFVVLAGLDRVDVQLGQFVLAGEPVGNMGESAAPAADGLDGDRRGSVLYVEFRKDGASIDPAPWWAKSPDMRKTGVRQTGERRTNERRT